MTIYSSGSHFIDTVAAVTITAAIGSSFDVTFTANASDVGSLTKMFIITDVNLVSMKFSRVDFIQNP